MKRRKGWEKETQEHRTSILIGIAILLLAVFAGWMTYYQLYLKTSTSQQQDLVSITQAEAAVQKEETKGEGTQDSKETDNLEDEDLENTENVKSPADDIVPEAVPLTSLSVPKKEKAVYSQEGAVLTWKTVDGAQSYQIFRKKTQDSYEKLAQAEECTYTDSSVELQQGYQYKIRACASDTTGKFCEPIEYYHSDIDPNKPMIALTFDDGPSIYTKDILKVLKKNNARATFFIVGERVDSYSGEIEQSIEQGCEIGSHSYSHANLGTSNQATIDSQLNKTEKKVKKVLGSGTPVMRPPYGSIGNKLKKTVGKPMILWSVDTLDWKTRNAKSTQKAIMETVKDGDIVLMHDLYQATRDAVKKVIPQLIKKGYQLVTVSEMAYYKGVDLKDGVSYTDMRDPDAANKRK